MTERSLLPLHPMDAKFFGACLLELGLGGLALGLGVAMGPDPRNDIPLLVDWRAIAVGFGVGALAGLLLAILISLVQMVPLRAIQSLNDHATAQLLHLLRGLSVPQLLTVALTAGVGEELLFRGWLMQSLTGNLTFCTWQEIVFGISVSSIVFGLAHPMSLMYVIVATIMGAVLGTLYWYFGNLLVPIVTHWVYDAVLMVWLVRMSDR
jgi:membrane protease YdiL (CAAX protease family)